MKRNLILIFLFIFLSIICFLLFNVYEYINTQTHNKEKLSYCVQSDFKECSSSIYELLIPKLLINNIKKYNQKIVFSKVTVDPLWVPYVVISKSRAFLYYSDEKENIEKYNFDFYRDFVYGNWALETYGYYKKENNSFSEVNPIPLTYDTYYATKGFFVSDISEVMEKLKKEKKQVILHLSISNFELQFVPELIKKYSDVISGINLFLEIDNIKKIKFALDFLNMIEDDFVLVSRNSYFEKPQRMWINARIKEGEPLPPMLISNKYYNGPIYGSTFVLSYINKNLIDDYSISLQQDSAKIFKGEKVKWYRSLINPPQSDIHWVVTITEKFRQILKK